MIKVVSWNIAKKHQPWRELLRMDADVALLQEAGDPPWDVMDKVDFGPRENWDSHFWNSNWYRRYGWRYLAERWPKVVKLSDRVEVEWFIQDGPRGSGTDGTLPVSGAGNSAVARVKPLNNGQKPFIVASMYANWVMPHPSAYTKWRVGAPDVAAHRIISDISTFIGDDDPSTHRVLAAGDLNMTYGWRDLNPTSYSAREKTVWDRMSALGMEYLGPKTPHGRRVCPSDYGGPEDTENVRTYHTSRSSPQNAYIQIDHVFASRGFHEGIQTRALNCVCQWGSSDHCRLVMEVSG